MDWKSTEQAFSFRTPTAFAVHVFLACGTACALMALAAAASADRAQMVLWLGVALIVDVAVRTWRRHVAPSRFIA